MEDYFQDLFQAQDRDDCKALACIKRRATNDQNERFVAPFTELDFKEALFSIHSDKSQGSDGINPTFFQQNWQLLGAEVTSYYNQTLNEGVLLKGLNETLITLIVKKNHPELVTNLCPIALCKVLYKILSKALANRLKAILPQIIYES